MTSGVGKAALDAATRALTVVHTSLSDMHTATDSLQSNDPRDRIIGPKGSVMFVVPEEKKEAVRQAMSISFTRGSKQLAEAERVIGDSESALQRVMDGRTVNPRRNETAVATVAAQIRDHVRVMTPQDRVAFVSKAIRDGDLEITTAILNASPFVSGLDRTQMSWLRDEAERVLSPAEYAERQGLRALRERLSGAGSHYLERLNEIIPKPNMREAEGARALKKLREGV